MDAILYLSNGINNQTYPKWYNIKRIEIINDFLKAASNYVTDDAR